jgi:hypothetical protein
MSNNYWTVYTVFHCSDCCKYIEQCLSQSVILDRFYNNKKCDVFDPQSHYGHKTGSTSPISAKAGRYGAAKLTNDGRRKILRAIKNQSD